MKIIVFLLLSMVSHAVFAADTTFGCKSINEILSEGSYSPQPNATKEYRVTTKDINYATLFVTTLPGASIQTVILTTKRFNPAVYSADGYSFKKISEVQAVLRVIQSVDLSIDYLCALNP